MTPKKRSQNHVMTAGINSIFLVLTIMLGLCSCDASAPGNQTAAALPDSQASAGRVIDARSNRPIKGAIVTINSSEEVLTDESGSFALKPSVAKIAARACGYTREEMVSASRPSQSRIEIRLHPLKPKALYLTVYGVGSRTLREPALRLI